MKKSFFKIMFNLQKQQPWIAEKESELESLLYKDCNGCDEKILMILDLIERFTHLTTEKYREKLKEIACDIVTVPNLNDYDTQIVALAADSSSDSSQLVLYELKKILEDMGWRHHKTTNRFGDCYKTQKRNPQHSNIILIDEFVGTGSTVINRVNSIHKQYLGKEIKFNKIHVKVIASTHIGKENIEGQNIDFSSQIILNKGISDYYKENNEVNKHIKHMLDLESLLSEKFNDREMPSLGYGSTESLYCRQDGNTPNSVFPIFWWPFYKNTTKQRNTLLTRAMGDA